MADEEKEEAETPYTPEPEKIKFQVRYADGGGEQIYGTSADEVREQRLKFWGDREIVFLEELKPVEP